MAPKGLNSPLCSSAASDGRDHPAYRDARAERSGEERRLFYVGMTRAQEELLLLTSGAPSVFPGDIPKDRLERSAVWTPSEEPAKQMSLF